MKTKNLRLMLVIVTILTLFISTISLATDNTPVTTSDTDGASNNMLISGNPTDGNEGSENEGSENEGSENEGSENETNTVELGEHKGDLYQTGTNVTINKAIDGNAFVFGNKVNVTGQINGDLYVMATNSLSIDYGAAVYGNVFVIAPNVTLDGVVYSLYAMTDNFLCKYNGMAALDIKVFANKVDFSGYVERHVYFAASDSLVLQDDACVLGNLNYAASNVEMSDNATIKGETYSTGFDNSKMSSPAQIIASYTTSFITTLTFLLVVLLAIILVKPSIIKDTTKHLTTKPFKTLGFGALAFILIPIISVICFVVSALSTVGVVLTIIYIVLLCLSTIVVTIGLANLLDNKFKKTHSELSILAYILLVGVVLWALSQIPYLGFIVTLLVWIFGLGTIIVSLLPGKPEKTEEPKKVEVKEEPKKIEKPKKEEKKTDNNKQEEKENKKEDE